MKKILLLLTFLGLIACYASAKEKEVKTDYRNALILAYSLVNSVYEDENIKLEIYNEQLWAINKTKKTIFIDLSQCFLVNNGASYPMYSKKVNEKKASKAGVSNSEDEYLTIAPSTGSKQNPTFICTLSGGVYGNYSTAESTKTDFSEYEKRFFTLMEELISVSQMEDPKGKEYTGTVSRHLTEDESISNIGANIAYAFNKKAEEWTNVEISTWVCDVIFAPYYIQFPELLKAEDKVGFGLKETDPAVVHIKAESPFEFNSDRSPLIICDWTGNVLKGTFDLEPTKIIKSKKPNAFVRLTLGAFTSGMSELFMTPLSEKYYKSVCNFDGSNDDWGKMKYAKNLGSTKQEK